MSGGVGIRFGGHVQTALAGARDHLQAQAGLAQASARDVHDVQRRPARRGIRQHLLQGIDRARFYRALEIGHLRGRPKSEP